MSVTVSLGLLILRVAVGLTIAYHGSQKLFGWFGGAGFEKTVQMMTSMGFRPAKIWTAVGGLGEFGGGILLALGFLTPLGAAAIVASMFMAVARFHWAKGFSSLKGGYEYPFTHMIIAIALGIAGPGAFAIDSLLSIPVAFTVVAFVILALGGIAVDLIGIYISSHAQAAAVPAASH